VAGARWGVGLLLVLCLAGAVGPVRAEGILNEKELGISEQEMAQGVASGRIGKDELIRRGRRLSYFTQLKLYYYAQKLAPFFEGLEESLRQLARVDRSDAAAVTARERDMARAMARVRRRLQDSGRPHPELDWRRGLVGLIFLDHQWRERIYQAGQDEIKNPYDLVALVDCMDARLRGLEPGDPAGCPLRYPEQAPEWVDWQ